LVAVKVGIERGSDQWVQTNRAPFNNDRFKSLNTKPMQSWRTV